MCRSSCRSDANNLSVLERVNRHGCVGEANGVGMDMDMDMDVDMDMDEGMD